MGGGAWCFDLLCKSTFWFCRAGPKGVYIYALAALRPKSFVIYLRETFISRENTIINKTMRLSGRAGEIHILRTGCGSTGPVSWVVRDEVVLCFYYATVASYCYRGAFF